MNTILFDLDGTLMPMDMETFEKAYFKGLCLKLINHFKPEDTIKYVWEATKEMVLNNDETITNRDVFMGKFCELSNKDEKLMNDTFFDYYDHEYKAIEKLTVPSEYVIKSVNVLKEKGYKLVVATNPLFPEVAILDRIKWSGLKSETFDYITCFEYMHFCKPNINYYKEILSIIGKNPEDCIMVGNDVEEDLIAGKIGIKTYLIENHILNKKKIIPNPDYKGTYEDFYKFCCDLPAVNI